MYLLIGAGKSAHGRQLLLTQGALWNYIPILVRKVVVKG